VCGEEVVVVVITSQVELVTTSRTKGLEKEGSDVVV